MNRLLWIVLSCILVFLPVIGMEKDFYRSDQPVHKIHFLKHAVPFCRDPMSSLALSPDGYKIAFAKKDGVGLWDLPTASGVTLIQNAKNKKVVWVPQDQNLFGTVTDSGPNQVVSLWDARTQKRATDDIELSRDVVTNPIVFTQDGTDYFVGNQDGSIDVCTASDVDLQKFIPFPMSGVKDWHAKKMPQGSVLSYFCNQARCGHIFFLAHCLNSDYLKLYSKPIKALALSVRKAFLASYAEYSKIILTPIHYDDEPEREQKDIGLPARPATFLFDNNDNLIVSLEDGALVSIPPYEYDK